MKLNNWKLFDKHGSPLNWVPDSYLSLNFSKDSSSGGAEGYLITDPSGTIVDAEILNSGIYYTDPTNVSYDYIFGEKDVDITSDVSISYVDVSVFNPAPVNTQGIGDVSVGDVSGNFVYPSTTYASALFLKPVSQGLVETEHLYILEEFDSSIIGRPFDPSTSDLVVQFVGDEDQIQLFIVDETEQIINWTDTVRFNLDEWSPSTPLTLNIGFKSDDEGIYERKLKFYSIIDNTYYLMGEILVNAESIGEDERFRTLLGNFGLPDPKDFHSLFKEADIKEALPDYDNIVNPKSKQMILEHDQIMPYVGTYKGLINAIKWLGYDDIYIREWFKNVKENKKLSLIVPYDAKDRLKTILSFSPEERKALKKLNQLSLNFCINKETGEIDDWGTPTTENCFEYNLEEIFVKLIALKKWLEKNIIGVNARIIDLTGEGVYFERYLNLIYSTDNIGFNYRDQQSLTPITTPNFSELINSESSINMTLLEYSQTRISDADYRFADYIDYIWDPNDPSVTLSPDDPSFLENPDNYLIVGPPLSHPFVSLNDIQWKASVEKTESGVVSDTFVTNPLWIHDNKIKFYNIFDASTIFYDSNNGINMNIILEEAFIRNSELDDWSESYEYKIFPETDPSLEGGYILESSTGEKLNFDTYVYLRPQTSNSLLQYAVDNTYVTPLMSFMNFQTTDSSDNNFSFDTDQLYFLDILDGKISMDASTSPDLNLTINYNYDGSVDIQNIDLNVEYVSPRMPIYVVDPSVYYWADPSGLSGGDSSLAVDNSIYTMAVHHSGEYNIEVFGWDNYNIMYYNIA